MKEVQYPRWSARMKIPATVIDRLIALGHLRATPPGVLRSSMGGGQAIMIDPVNGTLMGASDPRKGAGYRLLILYKSKVQSPKSKVQRPIQSPTSKVRDRCWQRGWFPSISKLR